MSHDHPVGSIRIYQGEYVHVLSGPDEGGLVTVDGVDPEGAYGVLSVVPAASLRIPSTDAAEASAPMVATSERPTDTDPHEVHQLDSIDELCEWAREHDVSVVLITVDAAGARIYAAHHQNQTRVAKGEPGQRIWFYGGFQT